ncbi:diadenylate cyclase [Thalassoglobus polymorphus]|uniref:DNA integrity scanning protein DisA n=1 Tax=Thalassoglobus polymorphus TaxID=2527994 RepID=A0A517QL46_9PLAN|nr:diadenylate cyclase [Thalassoglobus polymorphus]QDT32362.1 DNA integrity scanning protein DisA [Thalassoglobus polymorphus]
MPQYVRELFERVRFADLLDVAIVSMLLYVVIIWLRQKASRSLGIVAVGLVVLFGLAQWFDLYLTTLAYQYGSIAILITFVVIFQSDIRYGFEKLAASQFFLRSSVSGPSENLTGTLTEAMIFMARQRIGALVVIPMRDPLGRHIQGGVDVDAKISLPLLLSIFHPKSPGHDGAVLIERERIATLGVHLPLSRQVEKLQGSGTRHAAALGLAECCDAMVVAVSEERGTITIAKDGEMQVVDPTQLADRLRASLKDGHFAGGKRRPRYHGVTLLVSIATATMLWFTFAYNTDTIQRTFVIPIEYRNVPEGWEIAEPKPTFAELTLSGPEPAFNLLKPASAVVSLEVKPIAKGTRFPQWESESNLKNIPSELSVEQIEPRQVIVSLREKSEQ